MLRAVVQRRFCSRFVDTKRHPKILITGCLGQVGTALVKLLRFQYGKDNVIASDVQIPSEEFYSDGPFTYIDVTKYNTLAKVAVDHRVDWIVHNSSVPSLIGEGDPGSALDVHLTGIRNVLELSKNLNLRVLAPSSIAVFSHESGLECTPDLAVMKPKTIYGVSKCFTENLGVYYHKKYGVDFRSLRYPGVVSTLEEGASPALKNYIPTTDDFPMQSLRAYKEGRLDTYRCELDPEARRLPFMYIDDVLTATEAMLQADEEQLTQRVYNCQAISFSPREFEAEVKKHLPDFEMQYEVGFHNEVASSWPNSMDDTAFRRDFNWEHEYELAVMVRSLLARMGIISARDARRGARLDVRRATQPPTMSPL
eukprot:TRINITY_DN23148_c0_g1_i1.p1 TRINITY_DN23148_c0_g1~~TRINITY_DN23148_c0_g1_i1.p1  ORF type:complete len:367 (+),score=153.06 TRINITY_DN23148_c0_g1_i1:67-1167(+)